MGLDAHLTAWLGQWPPRQELDVVGAAARTAPGWDGRIRRLLGITAPGLGSVLSVEPDQEAAVRAAVAGASELTDEVRRAVADVLGGSMDAGVFRRAEAVPGPDVLPETGSWVEADDPRVPPWLTPFNGGVLLALDTTGGYAAGVGVKRHDDVGRELSVGTAPAHRGRGLATRLVATAARHLLSAGATVTYLHAPDNTASARVADAAGFPDRQWRVWGLAGPSPPEGLP